MQVTLHEIIISKESYGTNTSEEVEKRHETIIAPRCAAATSSIRVPCSRNRLYTVFAVLIV